MKGNKTCKVLLLFVMIIIAFAIHSDCYAESEKITENLEVLSFITIMSVIIIKLRNLKDIK